MRKNDDTRGIMAVEACFSLTLFLLIMLALYSLLILFMAQNMIGHALTESSQSLALESYGTSQITGSWSLTNLPMGVARLFTSNPDNNQVFFSGERWFDTEGMYKADEDAVQEISRTRFAAFLGGGEEDADRILRTLGVKDGLNGMDFSESKLEGSDLTISVSYTVQLRFRLEAFHLGEFDTGQSVCARLWGHE